MPVESSLETSDIDALRHAFGTDPVAKIVQNAVTATPVDTVALNRAVVVATDPSVSVQLDSWPVTSQKKSGRCWLFAGLNFLRAHVIDELKLDDFEFSQNYLHFYDKLEKANWFFTSIIELADRPVDDRTTARLLSDPIGDGGQWDMFAALVAKYGIVPKYAMPETESSSNTRAMNKTLQTLLRRGARDLRTAVTEGDADGRYAHGRAEGDADNRAERDADGRYAHGRADAVRRNLMGEVYRVLSIHLGTPPSTFVWQYRDKDKHFTRVGEMTPLEFARHCVNVDLDRYVCLVNDPRHPYGATMTVDYLGNVVGGRPIRYLNVPADQLEGFVVAGLQAGRPVWFGCDCGQQFSRDLGLWDPQLFEYEAVYGVGLALDKADRMTYGEEAMNHAMLFTGVDLRDDGTVRRFRVENSWGDEQGDKGFMTMNAPWFGEHVCEVAVPVDDLPADLVRALDQDPIRLPLWDPMGSLA